MIAGMGRIAALSTRLWALVAGAALMLVLAASPAAAAQQVAPVARPAVLTTIKLISESRTQSQFELTFDPAVTAYGPSLGAPNQPALSFPFTTRATSARQPGGLKGLVRQLDFRQQDNVLIVQFNATAPASAAAVQTNARTVDVTISSGRAAASESPDAAPERAGALPPANEPPEDYALVQLKYADVSEVVGLLTDGQTVKSNDVFIPSEPAFGSNSLTGNNYTPQQVTQAPGSNDDPLGQSVDESIGIDRRLNAIWLKGTPERIAQMKQMIAAIDIPVDSVVLETQFVELTEQGLKALGIDFNNANGQIGVLTLGSGSFTVGLPEQGCNSLAESCSGHVSSAAFQAALYAQIQKGNGRIVSRSIDDRIGAFVVLEALRRYAAQPGAARVVGVATTQEEIAWHGGGAGVSATAVGAQMAIVVDVTFATDHPGIEKKEHGHHPLGSGPVLARGSIISPVVLGLLRSTAEALTIPYTLHAAGRDTGTDADAIHIAREGIATALVSLPNRYMHSPNEMVSLQDVEHAAALIAETCRRVGPQTDFTAR